MKKIKTTPTPITIKSIRNVGDTVNMSRVMLDLFINPYAYGINLNGLRFLICLGAIFKEMQIKKEQKYLLDNYDDEYFFISKKEAINEDFTFKYSDFLTENDRNYSNIIDGIENLQKIIYRYEFERPLSDVIKNEYKIKGELTVKKYVYSSPLISSFLRLEQKGFTISISKFLIRHIVNLTEGYNSLSLYTISKINFSTISFYMWLKTFNYIKKDGKYTAILNGRKGTIINLDSFLDKFNLDYKYVSKLKEKFLEPKKTELNHYGDISFNYQFVENNTKLILVVFSNAKEERNNLIVENDYTLEFSKISKSLIYYQKKHNLSKDNLKHLITLYATYTHHHISNAINRKKSLKGLVQDKFIEEIIKLVTAYFEKIEPSERKKNPNFLKLKDTLIKKLDKN